MENIRTSAIAAIGKNRELGKNKDLIWKFEADFERMKRLIKGHSLIMGRTTYESIGRELPSSQSIVITSDTDYNSPYKDARNTTVVHSLDEALTTAQRLELASENIEKEVFIFGGAKVYKEALSLTNRLYLTEIDAEDRTADSFFPEYDAFVTVLESTEHNEGDINFTLLTLER
jgi:dihydrofolate reductase